MTKSDWSAQARIAMQPPPYKGIWGFKRKERSDVIAEPEWHIAGMSVILRLKITDDWNNTLFDVNTPIDENITLTYWQLSRNFFTQKFFDNDTYRRTMKIFLEDHAVLSRLNPVELPPSLRDEFSMESDGMMVAFRQKR